MPGHEAHDVGNLVATAKAAGDDGGGGITAAEDGKKAFFADLHREIVMFFFVAEGAGHATATGVNFLHGEARDLAKNVFHGGRAGEGFLVAVAMNNDMLIGTGKGAVQTLRLKFVVEEGVDHYDVFGDACCEVGIVDEVGQIVGEGGIAAGFADHDFEPLLDVGVEVAEGFFAVALGQAEQAAGEPGTLAAAGSGEDDVIAA